MPKTEDDAENPALIPDNAGPAVSWTASEFLAHEKSAGWYVTVIIGSLVLAALALVIIRDSVAAGVIFVAGLVLAASGAHRPRQLQYEVSRRGIGIAGKYRSYDEFKSFSVASEGAFSSIIFMPLKRFAVPLTIYYAPADEEKILTILNDRLPFEERHRDSIDGLMRRIRF